ncbi:hyaluronan synthase [Iodidimonas gelatinilytica]|uniref:Hyaluronan synthase n=2 Tax=Iodidimonas gelatinilytica TaxID=1236966 RepID=A0A5A7MYB3_9PROT|nr:hydrogen peroxide-inducible genes activator [Iodidimonas gelatinilytica]GEQ99835.1 hyaluronan synthase [Iodidimonas gelatinilytica]
MTITWHGRTREPSLRQIRYFLEVAKAGSYRRAAARIGVSQPTLTAQIAALEDILGCVLLERMKTGAVPTPLGRDLIGLAQTLVHEMDLFTQKARSGSLGVVGTHRLGVPPTLGPYLLPEVIGAVHEAYPDLQLYVREDGPRDLEAQLLEGHYDLILTQFPLTASDITTDILFDEPLILTASGDHPLSLLDQVTPEHLHGQKLLALEDRYRFFDQVQELAHRFHARLLREYEGTSLDTLRHMVGMNMGLGFLPALYVRSEITPRKDVQILPLSEVPAYRTIALAWRPSAPYRVLYRALASLIRSICREKLHADVHAYEPSSPSI